MIELTLQDEYRMKSAEELLAIIVGNCSAEDANLLFEPGVEYGNFTAKQKKILAVKELMGRKNREVKDSLSTSKDVYEYVKENFEGLQHEELFVLFLNRANKPIKNIRFSVGGIDCTTFDVRRILKAALELNACYMIMQHNHPSQNLKPSQQDNDITKVLQEAGNTIRVRLLDHLIITDEGYYSYSDNQK